MSNEDYWSLTLLLGFLLNNRQHCQSLVIEKLQWLRRHAHSLPQHDMGIAPEMLFLFSFLSSVSEPKEADVCAQSLATACTYPFVNQTTKKLFRMVPDVRSRISENHIRVVTKRKDTSSWDIRREKIYEPVGTSLGMSPSLCRVSS